MFEQEEISIWFFIGVSLLVNGVLILGAGLYEWLISPSPIHTVLYELHANVWWGAVLMVAGIIYCIKFKPVRVSGASINSSPSR